MSILSDKFRKRSIESEVQGYILLTISTILVCIIFYIVAGGLVGYQRLQESITDVNQIIVKCQSDPTNKECNEMVYHYGELKTLINMLSVELGKQDSIVLSLSVLVVLTVGFFIVHVFLKLYRYNMNMASFYRSLADSFLILEMEKGSLTGVKFDALVNLLLPKYISLETPEFKGSIDLSSILGTSKKT